MFITFRFLKINLKTKNKNVDMKSSISNYIPHKRPSKRDFSKWFSVYKKDLINLYNIFTSNVINEYDYVDWKTNEKFTEFVYMIYYQFYCFY